MRYYVTALTTVRTTYIVEAESPDVAAELYDLNSSECGPVESSVTKSDVIETIAEAD